MFLYFFTPKYETIKGRCTEKVYYTAPTGAFVGTTMEKRVDAALLPTKSGRGMSLKTFWTFLARYCAQIPVNFVNVVFFSHLS